MQYLDVMVSLFACVMLAHFTKLFERIPMRSPNMPPVNMLNFAQFPTPQIPRSRFDRSHGHTTTIDADYLYPVLVDEILPSDSVNLESTFFVRINTLLHPIMDNIHFDLFAFFIPFRLVWQNWQPFMGEQANPDSPTDFLIPHLRGTGDDQENMYFAYDSLHAYMGLPMEKNITVGGDNGEYISALYARAYYLVWNQWFRDENLQNSLTVPLGDGPDDYTGYILQKRNKRKDGQTSALPWQQKGDPVMLPLGTTAPVTGTGNALGLEYTAGGAQMGLTLRYNNVGGVFNMYGATGALNDPVGTAQIAVGTPIDPHVAVGVSQNPVNSQLVADLSQATAVTVNDLRLAITVQQLKEMYARGGTRYVELLRVEFGAISPDFRLQRAEYLAGSSKMMQISAVPQTSQSSEDSPQANLSAYGMHSDRIRVNYNSTEHGIIMVLANVRADIRYQSTVPKKFSRRTMLQFFHPTLQHLGEEAMFGREVNFVDGPGLTNNGTVFGYQERYYDYRYMQSIVTGKMNSNAPTSLDVWTLAQNFGNEVVNLNSNFIESFTDMDRVIAVPSEPAFYVDIWHKYHHTRPMAVRSIPGLKVF